MLTPIERLRLWAVNKAGRLIVARMHEEATHSFTRVGHSRDWSLPASALLSAAAKSPMCTRVSLFANIDLPYKSASFLSEPIRTVVRRGLSGQHVRSLTLHFRDKSLAKLAQYLSLTPQLATDISRLFPGLAHLALTGGGWASYEKGQASTAHRAFTALGANIPHLDSLELSRGLYPAQLSDEEENTVSPARLPSVKTFAIHSNHGGEGHMRYNIGYFMHSSSAMLPSLKDLTVTGAGINLSWGSFLPARLKRLQVRGAALPIATRTALDDYRGRSSEWQLVTDLQYDQASGCITLKDDVMSLGTVAVLMRFFSATAAEAGRGIKQRLVLSSMEHTTVSPNRRWMEVGYHPGVEQISGDIVNCCRKNTFELGSATFTHSPPSLVSALLGLTRQPLQQLRLFPRDGMSRLREMVEMLAAQPPERLPAKVAITSYVDPDERGAAAAVLDPWPQLASVVQLCIKKDFVW